MGKQRGYEDPCITMHYILYIDMYYRLAGSIRFAMLLGWGHAYSNYLICSALVVTLLARH